MPVDPINVEYYIGSQPPLDGDNTIWATALSSFVNAGFGDMLANGTHSLERSLIVYGITVPEGQIVSQQINVAFSTNADGSSGTVAVGSADPMALNLVNNALQSAIVDPLAEYAGGACFSIISTLVRQFLAT